MNKYNLNLLRVPVSQSEDINPTKSTWNNGRLVRINEGTKSTLYVFHEDRMEVTKPEVDGDSPAEKKVTYAFPIRVNNPVTRAEAINNAEMEKYGLYSAMEVASFNAALARKSRKNPDDPEVLEHDRYMEDIKSELTSIGVI